MIRCGPDLLLQADRAQELENIPYANSTKSRPDSRLPALPLLQGIVSTRTDAQVDTYAELDAIVTATREVLMASMANEKLWVLAGLQKHAPWKSDASALYQAIARFKDYKTTLSVDQLKLIGFPEATEETLNTVKSKLASYANGQYELTRVDYWEAVVGTNRSVSRTAEYYKPTAPKKLLTLADLGSSAAPPADQISKLLEAVPNVKAFWDQLKALGVEFPILNQLGPDLAKALWDNELVEFIRFTPDLPSIEDAGFAYNYNLAQLLPFYDTINNVVPFSLPVGLEASASVIPRLSIGVDNYWLQSIRNQEGKPFLDLLANSIYLFDEHEVDGTMIDLPELELDLSLLVTAGAMLGQAKGLANLYAEIFGGLNFSLEADLKADDTGKLRLADLFDSLLDLPPDTGLSSVIAAGPGNLFAMLGDNILDLVDFKGALDLTAGGELGLNVDLTPEDKSNLGAVTQALSDAYAAAASWLDLETHFNWKMGGEFTIPIFQFDTANGSFLLNV
jgi:hypothetical protein